jgi:hypothetical protein
MALGFEQTEYPFLMNFEAYFIEIFLAVLVIEFLTDEVL